MPTNFSQLSPGQLDLFPVWLRPYVPSLVNLVFGLLILLVGWFISKSVSKAVLGALRRAHVEEALARFLGSIAQYCVLAAAIISALNRIGVQTTSLVALLASAGLAIGLALQGSLSNFASGVMILFFRPFMLGDQVELSGLSGTVDDIGLFQTSLSAANGERVIIPNSSITSSPIINYSARGSRRASVEVSVSPGTPAEKVIEHLLAAAGKIATVIPEPAPAVTIDLATPTALNMTLVAWSRAADFGATQSELRLAVAKELAEAKIGGPNPPMTLVKTVS